MCVCVPNRFNFGWVTIIRRSGPVIQGDYLYFRILCKFEIASLRLPKKLCSGVWNLNTKGDFENHMADSEQQILDTKGSLDWSQGVQNMFKDTNSKLTQNDSLMSVWRIIFLDPAMRSFWVCGCRYKSQKWIDIVHVKYYSSLTGGPFRFIWSPREVLPKMLRRSAPGQSWSDPT